jgi:hypothetical protein
MSEFFRFAGAHPFLTVVLAFIALDAFVYPFKIVNRWIRSRNIKNAGWPPAHLDADGDRIETE